MTDVHLEYVNAAYIRVRAEASIILELSEKFTYFAENYKFSPAYKNRLWDGKIRLINRMTCLVYGGLARRIKKFCDENGYTISFDKELLYDHVTLEQVEQFLDTLDLPDWLERRDYQVEAIMKCIRSRRRTLLSPTSSGKSFMMYALMRWYSDEKTLIIVPSTGLVRQLQSDFESYGFKGVIDTSIGGLLKDNNIPADVVITTWQALDNGKKKMPKVWFNQFGVIIGDEAHGAKAATMIKLMTAMENTPYRFGTTGTLDNVELNKVTIEGLFGPPHVTTTTREMIDSGFASNIKIKCIVLRYPEPVRKEFKKAKHSYDQEIDFITKNPQRNKYIKNLLSGLKGNKLVFFRLKDHGKELFDMISTDSDNVFYIDGDIKSDVREAIRQAMEGEDDATLVASMGTTATGVSVKRLIHMLAGHPSKAKIKLLQAIGRMLRQHKEKAESGATMYDIVDDLSWGNWKNFTLKHFEERAKIYAAENFEYKIYVVDLK